MADAKRPRSSAKPRRASISRTKRFAGPCLSGRSVSDSGWPKTSASEWAVGREQQDTRPPTLRGDPQRRSRGARRLADAALAAEHQQLRVRGGEWRHIPSIRDRRPGHRMGCGGCRPHGTRCRRRPLEQSAYPRQCRQPAWLAIHRRKESERLSGKPVLLEPAEGLLLDSPPGTAPRTALRRRLREAIDDDAIDGHAAVSQRLQRVARFLDRHRLGQRDPRQCGSGRVVQDGVHATGLRLDAVDQHVGRVVRPAAANRVHQDAVPALHAIEGPGDAAEQRRHGQHPQHVAGRRRVDDQAVVFAGGAEVGELQQCGNLVDPGEREAQQPRHVVAVEPRAAQGNLFEQFAAGRDPPLERGGRVDLDRFEPGNAFDAARRRAKRLPESVAERRGGVSRDNERPVPGAGGAHAHGRGARRLADAPLASDEPECGSQRPAAITRARRLRTWHRCP